MEKELHWVKEAFSRDVVIMEGSRVVGGMHRDVLARDVDAYLNHVRLLFDVKGFLVHSVNIHDLNDNNRIIGHIEFNWFRSAVLKLERGEQYTWKREDFMMGQWSIVSGDPASETSREVVHYDRTRALLSDEGKIELLEESPNVEVLVLTGLFVRNYFLQKRRMAAAS